MTAPASVERGAERLEQLSPQSSTPSAASTSRTLSEGQAVSCGQLLSDPRDREERLPALVLLIRRGAEELLLPAADTPIREGDRVLLAGRRGCARTLELTLFNPNTLRYVLTGATGPNGALWRWLSREA